MNENIKTRVWQAGLTVGILLAVFLAVLSIKEIKSISYVGRDVASMNVITVTGTGDAFSKADVATFSFGVTETAKTVSDAQTAATNRINAAIKAVKDAGIADKDIKTTSYNINPHYEYQASACANGYCPGGKQVLTGYDVNQMVEVKVRDLDKAGSLFATIGSLGVQNINSLTFSVDDIEKVRGDARKTAIDAAQEKAKTLAGQLNVHLGRIISFTEDSGGGPIFYAKGMAMDAAAPRAQSVSPELPSGEQKVTSNVTITYEIR